MSRSYRKPYSSITCCGARKGVQKTWKRQCNIKLRRMPEYAEIPNNSKYKQISGDIWDSPSDGKGYNPDHPKFYRK